MLKNTQPLVFEPCEDRLLMSAVVAPMAIEMSAPTQGNTAITANQQSTMEVVQQTPADVQVREIGGVIQVRADNDPYSANSAPAQINIGLGHNYGSGLAEYTISAGYQSITLSANKALNVQDNTAGTVNFSAYNTKLKQDQDNGNIGGININAPGGTVTSQSVVSLNMYAAKVYISAPGMFSAPQTAYATELVVDSAGGNRLGDASGHATLKNISPWPDIIEGWGNTRMVVTDSSDNQIKVSTNDGDTSFVSISGGYYNNVTASGEGTVVVSNNSGGWVNIDNDGRPSVYAFNNWGGMSLNLPLWHNQIVYINNSGSSAYMNIQGQDDGGQSIANDLLLGNVLVYYTELSSTMGGGKG